MIQLAGRSLWCQIQKVTLISEAVKGSQMEGSQLVVLMFLLFRPPPRDEVMSVKTFEEQPPAKEKEQIPRKTFIEMAWGLSLAASRS